MTRRSNFAIIAAVAAVALTSSPVFAQSFSGGDTYGDNGAPVWSTPAPHQNAGSQRRLFDSAVAPSANPNDPALTGGGSLGFNTHSGVTNY